jgi:hypothetical protein
MFSLKTAIKAEEPFFWDKNPPSLENNNLTAKPNKGKMPSLSFQLRNHLFTN